MHIMDRSMPCSPNTKAFSGFAVDDLAAGKKFDDETWGLQTSE